MDAQDGAALPFITDKPLEGPPDCSWKSFAYPQLRAFPSSHTEIKFGEMLGAGVDGVVWKAHINKQVYAVKVFWQNLEPVDSRYWAFERESCNVAILQMIQTAIQRAKRPIHLRSHPQKPRHITANLHAFSTEGQERQSSREYSPPKYIAVSKLPRFRQCFGWTTVPGTMLTSLPLRIQAKRTGDSKLHFPDLEDDERYYAIVYEYIPVDMESAPTAEEIQEGLDLLWRSGFCFAPCLPAANWASGILLDMADLIYPWDNDWQWFLYRRVRPEKWS
ncbi:hypothetical protein ACRALDRAFT_1060788 [Sodiomyces alcalophilus JCM 7366]|uniref:uncharacterized protein n=1 Tax=Sodiomyces alcalophilus JCM 7366 TaxID=591952 RepID=UPI0039B383DB